MKIPCPDEERLADYLEGHLSEKDRSQVEQHLSDCETCLEALVITRNIAKDKGSMDLEPVPSRVTESAVRLVTSLPGKSGGRAIERIERSVKKAASKISDALRPGLWGSLQPVPIRGSKPETTQNLERISVSFKGMNTQIEIEKVGDLKAHIRVKPEKIGKRGKTLRATLKREEREIASYVLEGDYVLFEDVPFGRYSISLAQNGVDLGTHVLEVNETNHNRKRE